VEEQRKLRVVSREETVRTGKEETMGSKREEAKEVEKTVEETMGLATVLN